MNNFKILILKIGNKAVKDAQKESLKKGIANVYSKNRQLFFQLPNGEITQKMPKEYLDIQMIAENEKDAELQKLDIQRPSSYKSIYAIIIYA